MGTLRPPRSMQIFRCAFQYKRSNVPAVTDKDKKCHRHDGEEYSCHLHKESKDVMKPRTEAAAKITLSGIYFFLISIEVSTV